MAERSGHTLCIHVILGREYLFLTLSHSAAKIRNFASNEGAGCHEV